MRNEYQRFGEATLRVASSISVCFEVIQVVLRRFIFYANSILSGSEIPIYREQLTFSMRKYEGKLDASKWTVIVEATLTETNPSFYP
jgi:hypothetical protein